MAEPTSKYSLYALLVRVAVEMSIAYYGSSGDERAMPPIDAHNLDICKKVVEDGIKKFVADAPKKGWRWMRRLLSITLTAIETTGTVDSASTTTLVDDALATTYPSNDEINNYYVYITAGTAKGSYAQITDYAGATGSITVTEWLNENGNTGGTTPAASDSYSITGVETVNGDKARYPLPENFGGEADGPISYMKDTNHASIIRWASESLIRQKRAVTVTTAYPLLAAIRPLEPVNSSPSAKRRFELILDPSPNAADTLEFPYTLFFDELLCEAGDASSASTTTLVDSTFANLYPDDYFNGWVIRIISGTGKNSYATVTDYTGSTATFTVADWLDISGGAGGTDPAASSVYYVEPANNLHPAGFRFDWAILTACLSEAEMQSEEQASQRWLQEYMQKSLPKAFEIDNRSAPRRLGNLNYGKGIVMERVWNDITTDHDI